MWAYEHHENVGAHTKMHEIDSNIFIYFFEHFILPFVILVSIIYNIMQSEESDSEESDSEDVEELEGVGETIVFTTFSKYRARV